jgi:NAD(P)-dependent dehydrogenase (short-subunit alcohol dehydrogenase family)
LELQDKIIVVTGAASGIGRAMAIRFKAEGAKQVVAVDINIEGAQATAEMIDGIAMSADVSKEEDIQRIIQETENNVGPIDLFCSNAGVGMGESINSSNREWQMSWDINVMSHIYAARHLLPLMADISLTPLQQQVC